LECWELSQHLLKDTGKPRKTCVEVADRRTFRRLTSSINCLLQQVMEGKIKGGIEVTGRRGRRRRNYWMAL
jgi:hypothetical protein